MRNSTVFTLDLHFLTKIYLLYPNQDIYSFSVLPKNVIYLTDYSSNHPFIVLQPELIFDWYKRMRTHWSVLFSSLSLTKTTGKLKPWRIAKVMILNSEVNIHSELTGADKKHLLLLLIKSRVGVPSKSTSQPSKALHFTRN